jgi:protocatechuate 3,4-dioxygenase beta subunit
MKRIIRLIPLLISVTVLSMAIARAQSSPTPNKARATIAGRVTLDGAGAPGAHVMLKPYVNDSVFPRISFGVEQPLAPSAATDAEGRYRLTDVAPGAYRVSVFAPAYVVEGERDPLTPGKTINVAEGDNVEGVDFSLTRGAVITGKVTDEKDRPVIAAPVNIYKLDVYGNRQPPSRFYSVLFRWETDDRGVYRIFGLEAGRYVVAAGSESAGRGTGIDYRQTFHPDAVDATQARVVEVSSSEEATGINIKVASSPKGYVVTGHVVDADSGEPVPGVTVGYQASAQVSFGVRTGRLVSNTLGEFRFEDMPPDSYYAYVINIDTHDGGILTVGEEIKFDVVDRDVSGLEVKAHRGATISGAVAIEGSKDPSLRAKLAQVSLLARRESGRSMFAIRPGGNGTISPNGAFKLSNLQPGKTRIITGFDTPKGIALLRVEHNGVEVKEFNINAGDRITGVRLVFAYGNGVIAGRVQVKGGTLAAGARMKVGYRPEGGSATAELTKITEVDGRGQFFIEGLTEGTYRLFLNVIQAGENTVNPPTVEQIISVAGEGRHEVTFVVDLEAKGKDR